MKTTVVFHSADWDGQFCAQIARKFLPDAELIAWDFKDAPLIMPEGKLYVLDLPFDRIFNGKFVNGWWSVNGEQTQPLDRVDWSNVVWIDHHKSSIESHPKEIPGYRIDGVAASRLCWQWFTLEGWHPHRNVPLPSKEEFANRKVDEPLAVRLAGEYDIWDKRDPRAETFQFGLRSIDLDATGAWPVLLSGLIKDQDLVDGLLKNGRMLQTYQQRNDAGMMHRSFLVEFEGLKFLALTTARCNSLTFASKDVPETGHDALMGFYFDGHKWNVSLYHAKHNTGIDLSKIAAKFGGGGHRGACGFQVNKLPFIK